MCSIFMKKVSELEGALERKEDAEHVLQQLNDAFVHLLEDYNLLSDKEREDNRLNYHQAQQRFYSFGLQIIGQIINPNGADDVEMSTQSTSKNEQPMETEEPKVSQEQKAEQSTDDKSENWDDDHPGAQPINKGAIPKVPAQAQSNQSNISFGDFSSGASTWNLLPYRDHVQLMRPIYSLRPIEQVNERSLNMILVAIDEVNERAKELNYSIEREVQMMIGYLQTLLDPTSQSIWHYNLETEPTLNEFVAFLLKRSKNIAPHEQPSCSSSSDWPTANRATGKQSKSNEASGSAPQPKKFRAKCIKCSGPHFPNECDQFKGLKLAAKERLANKNKVCHNCFSPAHKSEDCPRGPCKRCGVKHNSVMCPKNPANY